MLAGNAQWIEANCQTISEVDYTFCLPIGGPSLRVAHMPSGGIIVYDDSGRIWLAVAPPKPVEILEFMNGVH